MAYRITEKCVNCGLCAQKCPMNEDGGTCIVPGDDKHVINPDICIGCGTCLSVCPVEAPVEE